MQLLDEQVDVVAPPVALVPSQAIAVVAGGVGKVDALDRIGIEVVVHVDGIDIISLQDVAHHPVDEVAALGQTGVKVNLAVGIVEKPLGVLIVDVTRCRAVVLATGHTVGVDPRMQLHAAAVALVNHELQRVPQRVGGLAWLACDPARPGFQLAHIGGIGLRPDLPYHCIAACLLQLVELIDEVGLVLGCRLLGILLLPDDVHPCPTELMLGVGTAWGHFGGLCGACHQCQQQH